MNDERPQRQVNTVPEHPQPHDLNGKSRAAIGHAIDFYESICMDLERVMWERVQQLDAEEKRSQYFLDMLGEIARMRGIEKQDDETLPQAVARFIEQLGHAAAKDRQAANDIHRALQSAFRDLCQKHNVTLPCDRYVAATLKPSEGMKLSTTLLLAPASQIDGRQLCETCGQPWIVHAPVAGPQQSETEAAS